jgi:hypothetical protein
MMLIFDLTPRGESFQPTIPTFAPRLLISFPPAASPGELIGFPRFGMVQILGFSGNSTDRPRASTVEVLSVAGPRAGSETLEAVQAQHV